MTTAAEKAKAPPIKVPRDGPKLSGAKLDKLLTATWRTPPGFVGWLASVDHKQIGRRYVVTALIFLALAGALAVAICRDDRDCVGDTRR